MILGKETILKSISNVVDKGLMDKDVIIFKLQYLVSKGELNEDDINPILIKLGEIIVPTETLNV